MLEQMMALTALMVSPVASVQDREYVIMVHGGTGAMTGLEGDPIKSTQYYATLDSTLMIGDKVLSVGDEGPETMMAVIGYFEGNPLFNAGTGATYTVEGTFELDTPIMEGKDLSTGAVAGLEHVRHPINAAYAVRTKSPHVMLSGAGAKEFAGEQDLEMVEDNMYFATPRTMEWIEKLKQEGKKNGTAGCAVLDRQGNSTAGAGTGGMFKKHWGRIGDSPVIGAGTYADNNSCTVSCTGHGEYFIRRAVAFDACARYEYLKKSVEKVADYIVHTKSNTNAGNSGLIAVDKPGDIAMPYNSGGVFRGPLYKGKGSLETKKGYGIEKKIVVVEEK